MASGADYIFEGSFIGAAALITVSKCPFQPRSIEFWADGGAALEQGYKHESMSGDAYLSTSTGTDAGVTITSTGFTVASGADVNVAATTVYYRCRG